jgi:hypothetical protein
MHLQIPYFHWYFIRVYTLYYFGPCKNNYLVILDLSSAKYF